MENNVNETAPKLLVIKKNLSSLLDKLSNLNHETIVKLSDLLQNNDDFFVTNDDSLFLKEPNSLIEELEYVLLLLEKLVLHAEVNYNHLSKII